MSTPQVFLLAILTIFMVPYLIWRIARADRYAPLVVVQICTGILLGPGLLGAAFPSYYQFVFNSQIIAALNGTAWWAVMIFVWVAGIELDLKAVWKHRSETVVTATLALGTPLIFGSLTALGLLRLGFHWIGPKGATWQFVLGIGMACAVTALPILILFMEELHVLRRPIGQRILRYASLDDIAIWAVLAVILVDWSRIGRQIGFLVIFSLVGAAMRKIMKWLPERDRWYAGLIWLAASGFAADWSGLHFMVGAFLSGVVLDASLFDQRRMDLFRDSILLAIMPVFFLSTGLRTNWNMQGGMILAAAVLLLIASVAGKLTGVHIAGKLLRWPDGEASFIGWLLQTKALIMIIFVNILLDKQIITNETFTALLLMAVGSTILTMPCVTQKVQRVQTQRRQFPAATMAEEA